MKPLLVALLLGLAVVAAGAEELPLKLRDIEGKEHVPLAAEGTKAVVLVFVSTDCPIANYYQPTLRRLQREFAEKGVTFFQVHPDPETPMAEARKHAGEFEVRSPVVIDAGQAVTKRLAATTTPEAFILTGTGTLAYRGRIDDTYTTYGKRRPSPTTHDLRDALAAVLAGEKPNPAKTKPVGCRIFVEE